MPTSTPIKITLYDPETDEIKREYSRLFIPWGILKEAAKLQREFDPKNMTDEGIETLAALVAEAFGNRFSVQDLMNGADVSEMLVVIQTIIAKATNQKQNPTPPG